MVEATAESSAKDVAAQVEKAAISTGIVAHKAFEKILKDAQKDDDYYRQMAEWDPSTGAPEPERRS